MEKRQLRILIIEDDEDDYILVRSLLADISEKRFLIDWVSTYEAALHEMSNCRHDVYLLDYRLGEESGLELLRKAVQRGCKAPIIFLTGFGDYEVDVRAMKAGAADYLVKGYINGPLLERSIRYAIERRRAENQLKLLSSQLITAQEEERNRIARELHDSIGSSLTAVKVGLENLLSQVGQGAATAETLKTIISITQSTIDEARRIMTDLRPSILDDLGIIITISWFCRKFQKIYSSISIHEDVTAEEGDIPENLKIVIFRVIQEAFNNIAKHSKADRVYLSLSTTEDSIELTIEDKGEGFDPHSILSKSNSGKGLGITSMKERTELSGGSFAISSVPGEGTVIRSRWPRLLSSEARQLTGP